MKEALCILLAVMLTGLVTAIPLGSAGTITEYYDDAIELNVSPPRGEILSDVTITASGLSPNTLHKVEWWTVTGDRVSGKGFVSVVWDIGTVTTDGAGGLTYTFVVPDDVGGIVPHVINVLEGDEVVAQGEYMIDYTVTLEPREVKEGDLLFFEVHGGGWTQMDATLTIVYDNSKIGYTCSFTNQGHTGAWITAQGAVGEHVLVAYHNWHGGPHSTSPFSTAEPFHTAMLNQDGFPRGDYGEPFVLYFNITESSRAGESHVGEGHDLAEVFAYDSLQIPNVAAVPTSGATEPALTVGNGGKGVVGGQIPLAMSGFPASKKVDFRWETYDAVHVREGAFDDKNGGYKLTKTFNSLGSVTTDATGAYTGALNIPVDFGGHHKLEAMIGAESVANISFIVVPEIKAQLDAAGENVLFTMSGGGWEKYTTVFNVVWDAKPVGAVTAHTTRGSAEFSIPIVGEDGLHTIEIYGGQAGEGFLNTHETSWPWKPNFRWTVMIGDAEHNELQAGLDPSPGLPIGVILGVLGVSAAVVAVVAWRRR